VANIGRLPAPLFEHWDWQQRGACRATGGDLFFAPPGERPTARMRRESAAKQICATCPVQQTCLQWALVTREPYGVWGGSTPEERANRMRAAS
jgi:WhiB family redox-sensing transcriptional regulator